MHRVLSLSTGPDFYRFVRTMEASKKALKHETTLVLPADSELFGLLFDSNHYEDEEPLAAEALNKPAAEALNKPEEVPTN